MSKDQLQQEILKRVKEGIKPSDFKKKKLEQENDTPASSPPPSPIIDPIDKQSKQNTNLSLEKKIKELEKDVKYWSNIANNYLKNLQLITVNLTNTEEENKELKEKIRGFQEKKRKELTDEIKEIVKEGDKPSQIKKKIEIRNSVGLETSQKLFNVLCDTCGNYKPNQHLNLKKLNSGLGMDLTKLYQMCDDCVNSGRFDIKKERNNEHDLLNW